MDFPRILVFRHCPLCIGSSYEGRPDFDSDPTTFHETLCRDSFRQNPVPDKAKGCQAQRALLHGGTLDNGQLSVEVRWSHGRMLRELIAKARFEQGEIVSCYGGFVTPAPLETNLHTHMRHIPLTDYVLEGLPFADCFPVKLGAMFKLGYNVALRPRCKNPAWDKVITSSGVGYMANTVTRCPLFTRTRPNVTVSEAMLGRIIPGVPYSSVIVLRASEGGIDIEEPIISPYEPWKLKKKFEFKCVDEEHYKAAGRVQTLDSDSE